MISWKKISPQSALIGAGVGLIVGVVLASIIIWSLISAAVSSQSTADTQLSGPLSQIKAGLLIQQQQREAASVYGHVVAIGGGTLVLKVQRSASAPQVLTFMYDDTTKIVRLVHDEASTEVPLSSDEIQADTGLLVTANEPIGSVERQHLNKIVQY